MQRNKEEFRNEWVLPIQVRKIEQQKDEREERKNTEIHNFGIQKMAYAVEQKKIEAQLITKNFLSRAITF